MNRRGFLGGLVATAGGLFLPYEPERVYSFASSRYMNAVDLVTKMHGQNLIYGGFCDKELFGNPIVTDPARMLGDQIAEVMSWPKTAFDGMSKVISHFAKRGKGWHAIWDHNQLWVADNNAFFSKPDIKGPWLADTELKVTTLAVEGWPGYK